MVNSDRANMRGYRLQTTDYRLQTTDYRLQTTDYDEARTGIHLDHNLGHGQRLIYDQGPLTTTVVYQRGKDKQLVWRVFFFLSFL